VAPRPGGTAAPVLGRRLVLAVAATLVTLSAGLLPAPASVTVAVSANFLAVAVVVVLLFRGARSSSHPAGWRWYAVSILVAATGSMVAAAALPWGQTALGSVPGQLLVVVALGRMLDRTSLRAARAQLATMLTLFVVADLLTVHTIYHLTIAGSGLLDLSETVALFALLCSIAIGTGVSLVFIAVAGVQHRAVGWTVFAGQVATAIAGAASSIATGPGPVQYLACAASVLGMGLLAAACSADRADRAPSATRHAEASTLGALLPHVTALVGGSLLLLSVPITGRLTIFGTALGVAGLLALTAHQVVSWGVQQQLTADLQRSEAYFRTLVRGSADPVLILDDQLHVTWVSPAITELLGLDPQRIIGRPIADAVHPDDAPGLVAALSASHADDETKTRTARVRHLDGRWRLIRSRVRDLRSDPDVGALVLYCRDVTATAPQQTLPDITTAFSTTDPATGLPNRSALTQRLGAALRSPSAYGTSLVLIGVDGLSDGDDAEVLRELASRFSRVLRGEDWLARAGIVEFAVVVDGTIADAEVVAARLVAAVEPVATAAGTVRLTAAAGVTPLTADTDAGEALRCGDLALRSARAAGPGRVRRHSDALRITQDREEALRTDLTDALRADRLHLNYQPVVDLALHRTVSVEALLRWRHPVYGDVSPAEFIPLAEESSLITEIGRWVLLEATATIAGLPHPDLGVAVNVSARHVRSGELVDDVLAALEASGLPACRLILEITESVLLDDAHVVADLQLLRRLGVRIAVDDFGTGWSSLAYLVGLPIDMLKMDRQFLADVETNPQRRALCSSVLHLGTSLGLAVVVEGVETQAELQLLRDMGHRFIQGFLLARPLDAAVLSRRLPGIGEDGVPTAAAALPAPAAGDPA